MDGKSWNDTYTRPCVANASNLTCYFDSFNSVGVYGRDITSRALAHAQGEMALCSCCGAYKYISDILKSTHDYGYYCRKNGHQQEFAYRFNEYNPEDKQRVYPRFTQRIIIVSSGKCFNYSIVGGPQNERDGNLFYEYTNGTFSGNFTIPGQIKAFNSTTYVYRGINTPQEAVLKRISMHIGVGPQISRPWRAIYLLLMSHYSKRCKPGAKRDVRIG